MQHLHGGVLTDAAGAVYKVVGGKLETDAPVAQYTTQGGNVLDGVWVNDKDMARAVDPRAFKPAGYPGWFVRMRDVVRPQGWARPAYSMSAGEVPEAQRMSVADLTAIVEDSVKNFPKKTPIHIRDDASTLHLIEPIEPMAGTAKGLTINGKIYLFRNGITGPEDARDTIFHELLHYGLRQLRRYVKL